MCSSHLRLDQPRGAGAVSTLLRERGRPRDGREELVDTMRSAKTVAIV